MPLWKKNNCSTASKQETLDGPGKAAHGTQYYSAICASLGGFSLGNVLGYASPATFQLRMDRSPSITTADTYPVSGNDSDFLQETMIEFPSEYGRGGIFDDSFRLNNTEIAWVSASFSIGALIGGIISSLLMRKLGRRGAMLATAVPSLLGWLLLGFGCNYLMLVFGRVFTGIFSGIVCVVVNTYIAEIASSDIRGILGGTFQLMLASGVVYVYFIGSYLMWYYLALTCLVPSTLFVILMYFNKESPSHLVAIGREEEAMKALQYFRGSKYDVAEELNSIKQAHYETSSNTLSLLDFLQPTVYKPFFIVMALMIFQQLCGINALGFNLVTIFKSANSSISADTSGVLCGVIQVLAAFPFFLLVDSVGRKILLILSAVIMAISLGCVGLFFYFLEISEEWTSQNLGWLPLTAVVIFYLAFSLGFGPMPWIIMGELFPPNVRETASSIAIATNWSTSFFVIYSFETVQAALQSYGYYWLYAGFCVLATLFSVIFVRETKGKTLQEITNMFRQN